MQFPISELMELVRNERKHSLTLYLGAVAPFTTVLTKLFQLVVQVSHGVSEYSPFLFGECF